MFELYQLIQLIAVSEQKTLSKAAETLHLSQPALSRSMQKLEQELNVTLFERKKNKIELNQTGKTAVEYARTVLKSADIMVEMVQAYEKSQQTISIGSCAPGALWEITPVLSGCYPGMTISTEIKSHEQLLSGLENETYQLIITAEAVNGPNVFYSKLCEEHLYLSLPPAHPLSQFKSVNLKDMAGETMLLMSKIGFWGHIQDSKMPYTKFILQNDRFTFDELVKVSALPSFTSDLVMKHEGVVPNRVTIPILDSDAKATYYCICLTKNKKKMAAFFQEIEKHRK